MSDRRSRHHLIWPENTARKTDLEGVVSEVLEKTSGEKL
jgi:hypothetical protein